MLKQLLVEIKNSHGTIALNELSRKLDIDSGALEGMLTYWAQKGHLRDGDAELASASIECFSGSCGDSCSGMAACPFIAKMPKTYVIPVQSKD